MMYPMEKRDNEIEKVNVELKNAVCIYNEFLEKINNLSISEEFIKNIILFFDTGFSWIEKGLLHKHLVVNEKVNSQENLVESKL